MNEGKAPLEFPLKEVPKLFGYDVETVQGPTITYYYAVGQHPIGVTHKFVTLKLLEKYMTRIIKSHDLNDKTPKK